MTQPLVLHAAEETLEAVHTRRHAAYPAYKPSDVEWLGDVPEHWETLSLKHVANVQFSNVDKHTVEGEIPVRLCNYTDVYYNDRITEDLQFMEATATKHEISRFKLERGDVLITKDSEDWSDIAVPALVVDEFEDVLCGYHLAQIRPQPNRCTGAYLARAFASSGIVDQFRVAATGVTRYGLPKNALRKAVFPVPPLEEQQAIARFLDEQTRKIDDLIEAKRSLLDLLKEKRQAVITHAVTRGLDPAAKLKPSGVEWLGDVPEHWDVKSLKYVTSIKSGENITYASIDSIGNYPVYGGNGVRGYTSEYTHDGDFVLIGRQGALCGNVHAASGRIWASEHCAVATPKKVSVRWLRSLLEVMDLRQYSETAAQPGLAVEKVLRLRIPYPSTAEQKIIARFLDEETEKMDDLESVVREAIETLESLRAGVISAAVTGKIDVRGEGV